MSFLLNEAFDAFCSCFDETAFSESRIRQCVESLSSCAPFTILFNLNAQKAFFNSRVWEPIWKNMEEKADGSCFYRGKKVENTMGFPFLDFALQTKKLHDALPALFPIVVRACREAGIRPFFSMRMNDVHHVDKPDSIQVSDFWREHQDCLTASYAPARFWWGHTLDYACPEVYRHHLALVREYLERFDLDGLELDWMRSPYFLKPGREIEDAHVLTQFMRDARELADRTEEKHGHPVELIVRIPPRPEDARRMGFDVPRWTEEKLISRIVLTSYYGSTDYDYPLELWRALLGEGVKITAALEIFSRGTPADEPFVVTPEVAFGHAASFYYRGSDDVYLFNFFNAKDFPAETLTRIRQIIGKRETVEAQKRRHLISFTDYYSRALGYLPDPALPRDASRHPHAFLRLNVGGATAGRRATLVIAWDGQEPGTVLCNGIPCLKTEEKFTGALPKNVQNPTVYRIPDESLKDGDNVLYFQGRCFITWCEIDLDAAD